MRQTLLTACLLAALCGLPGCVNEPTITNPYDPAGPKVTEDQLIRLTVAEEEKIKRQAEESAREAADDLDREKTAYDLAVADLEAEMQSRLRQLNADLAADTRAAESATRRAASMMNSALAQTRRLHEDGLAAIEREWAQREQFASILQSPGAGSLAGLVPGLGAVWPAIATGIGGIIFGNGRRRKAEDRAYVEGQEDKEKEVAKRDAAWIESQGEAIKMLLATGGGSLASLLNRSQPPASAAAPAVP